MKKKKFQFYGSLEKQGTEWFLLSFDGDFWIPIKERLVEEFKRAISPKRVDGVLVFCSVKRRKGRLIPLGFELPVGKCDFCGREFPLLEYAYANYQAEGCSASVDEAGITCHDGSRFDFNIFSWTQTSRQSLVGDSVCDNCIQYWLDLGWIELACENFWLPDCGEPESS